MQFHQFDQPVINLHELTNGLEKYYSPEFNQEMITRRGRWGYYQSLAEVVDILESVTHYKTARLSQYHVTNRADTLADQLPFYRYLNENFYIIACRRENLFEHAISHCLNDVTKKLNVYTPWEKIDSFYGLYRSGIEIQPQQILKHLERYRNYIDWADRHFSIGSYFHYEKDLKNIEQYILNLPVFGAQSKRVTWKNTFDQEFEDWNRCHYYASDIGSLALAAPESLAQIQYDHGQQQDAVQTVQNLLPAEQQDFLQQHQDRYYTANDAVCQMVSLGILPSSVPIKKQTLREKLHIVRNLDQCVSEFNNWIQQYPELGSTVDIEDLRSQGQVEYEQLWKPGAGTALTVQ